MKSTTKKSPASDVSPASSEDMDQCLLTATAEHTSFSGDPCDDGRAGIPVPPPMSKEKKPAKPATSEAMPSCTLSDTAEHAMPDGGEPCDDGRGAR